MSPLVALVLFAALAPSGTDALSALRAAGQLDDREWRTLAAGGSVVKVVDTGDHSEVLTFGAIRARAGADVVVEQLRDAKGRRSEPWILQSGLVGQPASVTDFAALALDPGEVRDLARCRVNDCGVRLGADAIRQLRQQLEAAPAADRPPRANTGFRQTLSAYAAGYQQRGNAALLEYANNDDPVRVADSLERLLQRWTLLQQLAPDLDGFLRSGRDALPADTDPLLYWTKERFWLLNVVSLNQLVLSVRPAASGRLVLAVSKQLYATHYYESSLGLTAFVETGGGNGLLFLVDRTRADIRRSGFSWVERVLLDHLVKRRLDARVSYWKTLLEQASPARSSR